MIQDSLGPNRVSRRADRLSRPARLALVLASAATGLVVVGGVAYASSSNASSRVVVHSGDTLWRIAASHYPDSNIEQSISQIESANHLRGASISPGETLTLPAP
ncbi:MAG TPA: LysM peptidoglycan-binding domain-containing protein [Candidatus Saccharimonadales bacterium]|nr:LysM peptidoglycan-binding domain-containing protein [Candidatus Saccharimonadales bacterium]